MVYGKDSASITYLKELTIKIVVLIKKALVFLFHLQYMVSKQILIVR